MWLDEVLEEIHAHARAGRVQLTDKAHHERRQLGLELGVPEVVEILLALEPRDFRQRLPSEIPAEWLYVFKPTFWRVIIYIKLALRERCVVISFHEDDHGKANPR
jgi:hypothetical protein